MKDGFNRESFGRDVVIRLLENGIDAEVRSETVEKLDGSYESLTFTPRENLIGACLNMNEIFRLYEDGLSYEECVDRAVEIVTDSLTNIPAIDFTKLSYDYLKEFLSIEAISAERNREKLENIPHKLVEDIAIIYRFVLKEDNGGRNSILITDNILKTFGISEEQLFRDAEETAPVQNPLIIQDMYEVVKGLMGCLGELPEEDEDLFTRPQMLIATTPSKMFGAGVIAYPEFCELASEAIGGDFYLLPSSVHEVIILPDNGDKDMPNVLKDMVRMVNATEVPPQDVLTDSVYHYDSRNDLFELADKYAARQIRAAAG